MLKAFYALWVLRRAQGAVDSVRDSIQSSLTAAVMPIQPQMTSVYKQAMSPTTPTVVPFQPYVGAQNQGEVLEGHQKISGEWPERCRASSACLPQVSTSECRGTKTPQCDHQGLGIQVVSGWCYWLLQPDKSCNIWRLWHTKDLAGKDKLADQGPAICHDQASHSGRKRNHAVTCYAGRCSMIHCQNRHWRGGFGLDSPKS